MWRVVLATTALMCAVPALASAAQSLSVTSGSGFPAGGDPSYTTTINLDTSAGSPGKVTIALAPGALASVAANPSCSKGAPQYTSACQIGTGSAGIVPPLLPLTLNLVSLNAYLVPPPTSTDLVGIDLVPSPNLGLIPVTHIGAQLVQTASGNVQTVLGLDLSSLGAAGGLVGQMSLTINGTLDGKPFTRMPTNCSPGSSTITIAYANKTETTTASPDFKPTGCSSLPFAPTVTGTAVEDANDQGVAVEHDRHAGGERSRQCVDSAQPPVADAHAELQCAVRCRTRRRRSAARRSTTPLLPTPLQGQAYLTGSPVAPTLTLRFPPPAVLTLVGSISLAQHTVTFPTIPDVPVTQLTVSLLGGPKSLLSGACDTPTGQIAGAFTGQNGKTATAQRTLTISGCSGVLGRHREPGERWHG